MKALIKIFLLIILSIFLIVKNSAAEDSSLGRAEDPLQASSYNPFAELKGQIAAVLVENKKLERAYAEVSQEYFQVKILVDQNKNEIERMYNHSVDTKKQREDKKKAAKSLQVGKDIVADDVLIKQSRVAYLKGQLMDMQEQERLWKLQLSDWEYQKRQFEVDYKYKDFQSQEIQRKQNEESNNLKKELQALLEQEKELNHQIAEIESKKELSPTKIERLGQENKELEEKIQELQRNLAFKEKEILISKDKQVLAVKTAGNDLAQKKKEKVELAEKVDGLQKELNKLNDMVDFSLLRQDRKRQLLKEIVNVDKENQELRTKIEALQGKVKSLKQ